MTVRFQGRLFDWNDERGFGFVEPNGGGERAFVHIGRVQSRGRRPADGDLISYEVERDERGRLRAERVRFARHGVSPSLAKAKAGGGWRWLPWAAVVFLLGLVAAAAMARLPWWIALLYLALSTITALAYWFDKDAARRGRRRTPESTLHLFELVGGWPGALIAQRWLRHKNRKASYQAAFWVMVVLNLFVLVLVLNDVDLQQVVIDSLRAVDRFW